MQILAELCRCEGLNLNAIEARVPMSWPHAAQCSPWHRQHIAGSEVAGAARCHLPLASALVDGVLHRETSNWNRS